MKEIDALLKPKSKKDIDQEIKDKIQMYKIKYKQELEDFEYIKTVVDFSLLTLGGQMRLIDYSGNLKWGGILKKVVQKNDKWYGIIQNRYNKMSYVLFDKYFIFYKKLDKSRDLKKVISNYFIANNKEHELVDKLRR